MSSSRVITDIPVSGERGPQLTPGIEQRLINRVAAAVQLNDQGIRRRGEDSALAGLTGREQDILALMAQGRSNRAICERLFLSPKNVETHVGAIFAKLGLLPASDDHRRVLAVITYLRNG